MIQKNLMTLLHNLFAYHTHNRTKLERVLSTEHNETSEHAFNSWYINIVTFELHMRHMNISKVANHR